MSIRYRVTLTADERRQLQALLRGGQGAVRQIKRAQILLAADAQVSDERIAADVGVGISTVYRTKQHFVEDGLARALSETPRPGAPRKLSASDEARLVAVACSAPPAGRARWTLELLAGELIRLTTHATLSRATVGRRLADLKAEAVAGEDVVRADGQRRVRRADGRRARSLRRAAGAAAPRGLLRRNAPIANQ